MPDPIHLAYLPAIGLVFGAVLAVAGHERRAYRRRQQVLQRLRDEHLGKHRIGWDGPDRKGLGTDGR